MAFGMFERVRETWTGTGNGSPITLDAAYADHRRFNDVYATNDTFFYFINHSGSNAWEAGYGTYNGSNQITRTTVIESTNSNLAVVFAGGTKDVWVAWPASVAKNLINGTNRWVIAGGTADAITLTYTPAVPAYLDGLALYFRAVANNTAVGSPDAPTSVNVNSLGSRNITKAGGTNLAASDIKTNGEYLIRYNGTQNRFELLGGPA